MRVVVFAVVFVIAIFAATTLSDRLLPFQDQQAAYDYGQAHGR